MDLLKSASELAGEWEQEAFSVLADFHKQVVVARNMPLETVDVTVTMSGDEWEKWHKRLCRALDCTVGH